MPSQPIAFRWPAGWKSPENLELLRGVPIAVLLAQKGKLPPAVEAQARTKNLQVVESPGGGAQVVRGPLPGFRMAATGAAVSAGPTGEPWIDSNGWRARLAMLKNAGSPVYVDCQPPAGLKPRHHLLPLCDAAAVGASWIVALEAGWSAELAKGAPAAVASWKQLASALNFFEARKEWTEWTPQGNFAVVADFSRSSATMAGEILNLTARLHQPYRILEASKVTAAALAGLQAILYPDPEPRPPALVELLNGFAEAGGTLIAGPGWPKPKSAGARDDEHPRFEISRAGKGRLAVSTGRLSDPYLIAGDARWIMSRRYDVVRFWNAGAMGSNYASSPDRSRGVLHLINYATEPDRFNASVRVVGHWKSATLSSFEMPQAPRLETKVENGGIEILLPPIATYAAIELRA